MFKELNHKTYIVGGAVRNELLGLAPKDIDYVVEANETEYEKTFPNHQKIGKSFPVYLNDNGDEVALTRVEKSTGNSDKDFVLTACGVSITDDLARRDFSINSIAKHFVTGEIIDPFNGVEDIKNKLIRTVNDQFVVEDPNRVYRLARFVAEFGFSVEENTANIVRRDSEFVKNVEPDRVFVELKKVYDRAEKPSLFFKTLLELDILKIHFKPLYVLSKVPAGPVKYHGEKTALEHSLDAFDFAKANGFSFDIALAGLFHDTGKGVTKRELLPKHHGHEVFSALINKQFVKQHRFTAKQNELIVVFARNHMFFHVIEEVKNPLKLVRFFKRIKKHAGEIITAANTDHPLTAAKLEVLDRLVETFKSTVVDIPKSVHDKGKESVVSFVEQCHVKRFKELSK